ncbi:hypothetical protein [Trinickia dinghuensis]|uniref:Uncharacterized protein n=1 Tax=Trinickia dinghuensis TaxID=2291023 RepID=A0A3D8JQT5_9BURK|nr:hypothetical protein [Trinickia dinghuensis]RDU95056.1 hypothetical protein DWV00_31095 [Trinickia dinghuensis]
MLAAPDVNLPASVKADIQAVAKSGGKTRSVDLVDDSGNVGFGKRRIVDKAVISTELLRIITRDV